MKVFAGAFFDWGSPFLAGDNELLSVTAGQAAEVSGTGHASDGIPDVRSGGYCVRVTFVHPW